MSTIEPTAFVLTAENIKALRNADSVSFHHLNPNVDRINETTGPTYVQASKRVDPKDGFGTREIEVEIPAEVKWTIYERNGNSGRTTPSRAFMSIQSCQFAPEWVTFAQLLKTGDRLVLHWTRNGSDFLRDAGLVVTEFRIEVRRSTKAGKEQRLVFLLDTRVEKNDGDFYLTFTEYTLNV